VLTGSWAARRGTSGFGWIRVVQGQASYWNPNASGIKLLADFIHSKSEVTDMGNPATSSKFVLNNTFNTLKT
jgi:hypothetical protein